MTGSDHAISVWFLCKSCGFTFHFQHVDEFLEHKKRVHFSEFTKIRCIVFEEKLGDNPELYVDQTSVLDSNLLPVDKVELPEGEVECFWEPETKPSASISTNGTIIQDSPGGNEILAVEDPKLLSSYVLARRLKSLDLQFTQKNKIKELPRQITGCLNTTPLQPVSTILQSKNDIDELPGDSTVPSQESNTSNSNLNLPTFDDSNSNRIVSFRTDPTEESVITVEITDSQNVPSCDFSNHSSSYQQFCKASGDARSILNRFTDGNNFSDQSTLANVLDPNSEASLDPSLMPRNNSVVNEFEDAAENDVTQEIYVDFETVVHSDEVNLKPEVHSSGLTITDENRVKEKIRQNTKYNPYVLVKRLTLTDLAIGPEKDELSEHSECDNDDDYQPSSPQDGGGSDSDFDDDEPRARNQHPKRNSSSRIRVRQGRGAFIFPSPESDGEDTNDPLTLKDWILHQMKTTESNALTNIILLDPDPTIANAGPVTSQNPIACKLCCKKLTSETEVKVHVTHCWLRNKTRHRHCVPCNKTLHSLASFREHSVRIHGTDEEKAKMSKFKCDQCPKTYWHEHLLRAHLETHKRKEEQNRPFVCETCGSRFLKNNILQLHLRTHSSEKPFKCSHPNCTQAFKTPSSRRIHEDSHPEKPKMLKLFACKFCNKSFRLRCLFKLHLITHSNDRPFKCDHPNCSSAFKRLDALKLHNRNHGNPRTKKIRMAFKFPYLLIPEANSESDDISLADWIANQTEEIEGTPLNVIMLEPDPTKQAVGPITQQNYISCKLCCEKFTSESRVKVHVTHCWLRNKTRHRHCVPCNKTLHSRTSFREHSVRIHGTEEE